MKRFLSRSLLTLACITFARLYAETHAFTVRDDIGMVRFNDPSALHKGATAKVSPDGRLFAVVTSRGIIESDQIESTLSVFSVGESEAFVNASDSTSAPHARFTIRISAVLTSEQSNAYGAVITDLRWSADSRDIYFLAETLHRDRRLYRANIGSGKVIALSPEGYHVARFDCARSLLVYSAWRTDKDTLPTNEKQSGRSNPDARSVTGESLQSIVFPGSEPAPTDRELWVVREKNGRSVISRLPSSSERDFSWLPEAFSISPSGRMLVHLRAVTEVPNDWSSYEPAKGFEYKRIEASDPGVIAPNNIWRLKEYSLVNLDTGSSTPLLRAPQAYALAYTHDSKVVWSPNERRILLTNTFLPLDGVAEPERARRLRPCAVAEVQLPSLESHCILPLSDPTAGVTGGVLPNSLSFGGEDEVSLVIRRPQGGLERRKYAFYGCDWQLDASEDLGTKDESRIDKPDSESHLKVSIDQGLNQPPTLWVTDLRTQRSKRLWDPNPQFSDVTFGQATVYRWKDKSGYEWKGGLVKPVGYVPGRRYPLVLQIYDFDEDLFLTDGQYPTAMAARELASAGIVVLQIQRKLPRTLDDAEAEAHIEAFRSAIDNLSNEGLVDKTKVGLVGFSGSAWYVESALIRYPSRFAAATIADGVDVSYLQYRLGGESFPALAMQFEKMIGSKPVGTRGLEQWLTLAPGFHLDRVTAPVRLEAITPLSVLAEWEIYSSLRMQRKAVDLIYFPDGQHIHQRPLERLESQQGDVDWFRFWLQGFEDPAPSKRGQYTRWERLRDSSWH